MNFCQQSLLIVRHLIFGQEDIFTSSNHVVRFDNTYSNFVTERRYFINMKKGFIPGRLLMLIKFR